MISLFYDYIALENANNTSKQHRSELLFHDPKLYFLIAQLAIHILIKLELQKRTTPASQQKPKHIVLGANYAQSRERQNNRKIAETERENENDCLPLAFLPMSVKSPGPLLIFTEKRDRVRNFGRERGEAKWKRKRVCLFRGGKFVVCD